MFGPGMEQLDVSLVTRLMHAPDVLPVSGTPHRQINGEVMMTLKTDFQSIYELINNAQRKKKGLMGDGGDKKKFCHRNEMAVYPHHVWMI